MAFIVDRKYKFHTEEVGWAHERKQAACIICKKELGAYGRLAIRGSSCTSDIWLRAEDDSALLICKSESCFNMILLDVEKYIRIPF